jgi:glycosyltransferase involved in cell wall biosynthesis
LIKTKSMDDKNSGVLFIMPRSSSAWNGAEALWITVAGWAAAAEHRFGTSWIITSDRISTPNEVASFPLGGKKVSQSKGKAIVPRMLKTLVKDFLLWRKRNRKSYENAPWHDKKVLFVWEQHDLFAGPGLAIAKQLNVPFVLYVHAPAVWEASKWGVKRPVWGWLLERYFERRSLMRADVVACVSQEVALKVASMGIPESKIIISPMGVDPQRFNAVQGGSLKERLQLTNKFVVGWIGSFRGFHGLDSVVRAFASAAEKRPDMILLLVGDGGERPAIEKLVGELKLTNKVKFTGKINFPEIPAYVNLFDIAVVSAGSAESFHYSPLKLREYLISKKATIAPRAGEVPQAFTDGQHLLLYTVSDHNDLQQKMERLYADASLRKKLGEEGYLRIMETGTWDYQLQNVLTKLNVK